MVQVPGLVTIEGSVDDVLLVQAEELAIAYALHLIDDLPLVGNLVSDPFTDILNHDICWGKIFKSEQSVAMNLTRSNFHLLWLSLAHSILHSHREISFLAVSFSVASSLTSLSADSVSLPCFLL